VWFAPGQLFEQLERLVVISSLPMDCYKKYRPSLLPTAYFFQCNFQQMQNNNNN
jgi:hypothetical protein